jgi:putative transposase
LDWGTLVSSIDCDGPGHRFVVLPKRWIVERTFAWLNWSRRLSKDYELRPDSAGTTIHIAHAHLMLRRLA